MLLLSGITPNLLIQPASAVTSTPAPMNSLFGPRIYKSMVHVNAADKGEISPYFHRYLSNYSQNGYDSVLFNMDHDLLEITEWEPYNGGFETWTPWVKETTSSVSGSYTAEQSSAQARDGSYSLHAKASVSGSTFGSAGVFQDMLWEVAPVAADLNLAFSVYPVSLKNTTTSPDSLIVVELDFNHYDSATVVPRMFLVLQDSASEPLSSGTPPFINTANDYYVVLNSQRSLTFGTWNYFNLNITDLAVGYYGQIKAYNLKIDGIHIDAYSRNKAVSEFYMDGLVLTSKDKADQIYPRLASVVKAYDTAALRMVPGEKLDLASALLYFNIDTFFQPTEGGYTGVRQTINNIHSRGDYVFISKPDESEAYRTAALNNLWAVDGISVFSTHNKHSSGFAMDIWDYYLSKGVLAMAIAEQHPMHVRDVQAAATAAPTQFIYAADNSPATTVEAMAQGRGFVEGGYVRPMMPLFFSAESSQVAAGKFPIYVDWSRSEASLNINLQNIPFVAKTLRIIRNGTIVDTISLQGVTSYNDNLTFSLPDKSNYFRFEVLNANGTVVAFSNPIIYVKTEIPSDMWLALSPSLQYGSATSSISSIKYGSGTLSFTATSKDTIQVTTKIFTSKAPSIVLGAQSWKYDTNTKILSINSKGAAKITANFNNVGILSVTTTPVNGTVLVDGSSWGKAPVSRVISNGSHTVSFGSVTNYTKPANIPVSIAVGQEVSVTGTYTLIPPTKGNLSVSTTPVNGTVFVDGDSWGKAPVRKVVATGSHIVSFGSVPNYTKPADITVSVNTNQSVSVTGNYTLIPPVINGTLSVTTAPVDGEVFVNGTIWGLAPVSKSIASGSYAVSFGTVPNYTKPANIQVSVTTGQNTPVTGTYVQITPPPPTNGTLSVTTTPVNGAILVDGTSWGLAPVSKSVAAGSHTVSFGAVSGYTKPADVTVSVTAGSNTPVTGTYTPSSPPPSGPFTLSFQGYDYDNKEEVIILVNNQVAATLPASETPKNSDVFKSFSLDITNYVVPGANTITFKEIKDHSSGVRNVQVTGSGGTSIYSNGTSYTLSGSGTQVTYKFSAESAPPPSNGTLLVTTTPVNGEVVVDGVSWGTAPVSKSIAAGSHTVSFAAVSGYTSPSSVAVSVTAGATASATGTYTLVPSPSSSQFTLSFQGYDYDNKEEVTILVNNQVAATLPANDSSQSHKVFKGFSLNITRYVVSGVNTITFKEGQDHSTGVKDVQVTGSSGTTIYSNSTYYTLSSSRTQVTYKFSATVTPTTGTLLVTTTPVNGQVVVDGVSLGTAPVSKSIAAGSHTVSFGSVSGYTAQSSVTVTVKAGQTTSVTGTYILIPPPPPPPPPPAPPSEVFVAPPPVFSPPSGSALPAREATPPTLVLNKATFDFNDKLVVTGTASPSSTVTIKVLKPNSNNILGIEQGSTNAAGAYNVTVLAWPSTNSTATPFGTYTITVTDSSSGGIAKSTIIFKAAAISNTNTTTTTTTTSAQTTATVTVTSNNTIINTVTADVVFTETATTKTTTAYLATVTSTTTAVSTATVVSKVNTVVSAAVTTTTLVGATTTTTTVLATQAAATTRTVTLEVLTGLSAEVTYAAIGIAVIAIIAAALLATRRRR